MKTYKIEIELSQEQQKQYWKTINICRGIYNLFIAKNKELYESNKETENQKYINNYEFSKWLNNEYAKDNLWIKEVSSKSIRYVIDNAHNSFMRFFKKQSGFPKYKKKGRDECGMYFVKNGKEQPIRYERHKIKIATLGWVKFKEYGYIKPNKDIRSGMITTEAGRYYISLIVDEEMPQKYRNKNEGIGIDLGVKDFAILSNGTKYKTLKQIRIEKRLKREQRKLARKYEMEKKRIKKGERTETHKNIERQRLKIQRLNQKIVNKRAEYHNQIINEIIKREPSFIVIEDLNVKGMMKNRHLSKAIANQGFYTFITKLKNKCKENGIELRQVDRFYASSKICSCCGLVKTDLKLSDRIYKCECGNIIDRDINASINLRESREYRVIA